MIGKDYFLPPNIRLDYLTTFYLTTFETSIKNKQPSSP